MSVVSATGVAYKQKLTKIEKEKKAQEEFSRKLLDSQEQERKKIANELHHTIAHDVLITKNKAVIGLKKADNPEEVKSLLNEISDLATNTLHDVRSISYNLHPHQIESLGLTKAIKSIVNRVSKSTDMKVLHTIDNIDKLLSPELEINVFRIIQECYTNIIKHSEATESELKILKTDKSITVIISDNGKGFSKSQQHGLGMREITERIKLYNGVLNIESEPGKGTIIHITLPIN
jgi:signal transduction histidine kinase